MSIGLPVFNGENYLSEAIASILAQTFTGFELVISDNASTDRTEAICREYAALDERIRYYRNDRDVGATANFNRVFELASGEYFKWAAHDDIIATAYLEKCVAVLDACQEVVLCHSFAEEIDETGKTIIIRERCFRRASSHRASDRFGSILTDGGYWLAIYGLIRAEALRKTVLHGNYEAEEFVLLAELSLLGAFAQVSEPLLVRRDHPGRFGNALRRGAGGGLFPYNPNAVAVWYQPHSAGQRQVRHMWMRCISLHNNVRRHVGEISEQLRCYGHLLHWFGRGRPSPARLLLIETIAAVCPRSLVAAQTAKRWLFGPGPIFKRTGAKG